MKLLFIVDPLDDFKIYKDSTYAMMREAAARGHALYAMEQEDLLWRAGIVYGNAARLTLTGDESDGGEWYEIEPRVETPLQQFDVVMMRKDPPFDMEYVYSTYLLELAEAQGARVVNKPRAIRDHNEKLAIARYADFTAPTLVTRQDTLIRSFLAQHQDIILKPLDGMGGTSVFRVQREDPNVNVIIETLTHYGRRTIMAQRFIPQIRDGDKRVLIIAGKPVPYALARIPRPGDATRGSVQLGPGRNVARKCRPSTRRTSRTGCPQIPGFRACT